MVRNFDYVCFFTKPANKAIWIWLFWEQDCSPHETNRPMRGAICQMWRSVYKGERYYVHIGTYPNISFRTLSVFLLTTHFCWYFYMLKHKSLISCYQIFGLLINDTKYCKFPVDCVTHCVTGNRKQHKFLRVVDVYWYWIWSYV